MSGRGGRGGAGGPRGSSRGAAAAGRGAPCGVSRGGPPGSSVASRGAAAAGPSRGAPDVSRRGRAVRPARPALSPGERLEREYDVVATKPANLTAKQGVSGNPLALVSNYFKMEKREGWNLFHYRVDFKPEQKSTNIKKQIMQPVCQQFNPSIFDGHSLYTPNRIRNPTILNQRRPGSGNTAGSTVEVTIRLVSQVDQIDYSTLQFYNLVVRKCLELLNLKEMGRHYFDKEEAIAFPELRLSLWPGYITSMRHHEQDVLLCVEPLYKVLRTDTVLSNIRNHNLRYASNGRMYQHVVAQELVGGIVMTMYNNQTYKIADIKWDLTPNSPLPNGPAAAVVTYMEYYSRTYGCTIKDLNQPLLVAVPQKKDHHRGIGTNKIYLIPELCQMTGLTDSMRKDNKLMKQLAEHTHMSPTRRHLKINTFMARMQKSPEIKKLLTDWEMGFSKKLVQVTGRILDKQPVKFELIKDSRGVETQTQNTDLPDDFGDWTAAIKKRKMVKVVHITTWVLIIPVEEQHHVENLLAAIKTNAKQSGFTVLTPVEIVRIRDARKGQESYIPAIDNACTRYKGKLQMIFMVMPDDRLDSYSAVKTRCFVHWGISSQCFLAKNLQRDNFNSIISKLVIQMATKLDGIPWEIFNPLSTAMVIGFDVYHCANRRGSSIGALVASINPQLVKYFSTVSFHEDKNELSSNLCGDITKALRAYSANNNGNLPKRIFMYRDGIGEGQLSHVFHTELDQIKTALKTVYENEMPNFTFIVVTKRIHTRLMAGPGAPEKTNPQPGTVVDNVITLPERHDFFLVSSSCRQGTVSPTCYNVLFDSQGLSSDILQIFTYKMCHLYYNCSTTVSVPAPCQYAHKLAYMTGMALSQKANEALSNRLYYL